MRALLLILLALTGCDLVGPSMDIVGQRPMYPVPSFYATYYAEVEDCLGISGDYEAINWFVADEINYDGWNPGGVIRFPNEIIMREARVNFTNVIKHEMIHHIKQRGNDIHDNEKFGTGLFERCAVPVVLAK